MHNTSIFWFGTPGILTIGFLQVLYLSESRQLVGGAIRVTGMLRNSTGRRPSTTCSYDHVERFNEVVKPTDRFRSKDKSSRQRDHPRNAIRQQRGMRC